MCASQHLAAIYSSFRALTQPVVRDLQALAATTRAALSKQETKDSAARDVLAASADAIQGAISRGVYGSGQGRLVITEHQVATMQS